MSVSSIVKEKVAEHDLTAVRDALFMATMKDPGFSPNGAVAETLEYCFNNGIKHSELFQDDDGRELPRERTKENLAKVCASLRNNFSEHKLAMAKEMGRTLYPIHSEMGSKMIQHSERKSGSPKKVLAAILVAALLALILILMIHTNKEPNALTKSEPRPSAMKGVDYTVNVQTNAMGNSHSNASVRVKTQN